MVVANSRKIVTICTTTTYDVGRNLTKRLNPAKRQALLQAFVAGRMARISLFSASEYDWEKYSQHEK